MPNPAPCRLCPRQCGVQRFPLQGTGFCQMGSTAMVARAAPHFWEEPCISGKRGTGAVFFSACTLRCSYCQNWEISHKNQGYPQSPGQLADIFRQLEYNGAQSLSLVTATHFLPAILDAFDLYKPRIPVVYNCGGYESTATIRALDGVVDVWLPDIKNMSRRLSKILLGCEDYFDVASLAVKQMCQQSGQAVYNEDGIMTKGTLVRHLLLPGCTSDSIQVLRFIAEELPKNTPVSLMRQYTPMAHCKIAGLDRKVSDHEYGRVLDAAFSFGLMGYLQDAQAADKRFTPLFDGTGLCMS